MTFKILSETGNCVFFLSWKFIIYLFFVTVYTILTIRIDPRYYKQAQWHFYDTKFCLIGTLKEVILLNSTTVFRKIEKN